MPTVKSAMPSPALTETDQRYDLSSSMVSRMTRILDAFGRSRTSLTLEEVEARTSLPRSTAHRILNQLIQLGWITRGQHGYSLGRRALQSAGGAHSWDELRKAAAPVLHGLQVHTKLVVHLGVLDGPEVLFLDKIGGTFAASLPSDVGTRWWVTNNGLGKAMLAYLPPEDVQELLRDCPEHVDNADEGFTSIHCELNVIRRMRGLVFDRGGGMPGVGSVACVIRGADGPVGAISVCGELAQMHLERLAPLVATAAHQVAEALYADGAEAGGGEPSASGAGRVDAWPGTALRRDAARAWLEGPYGGGCCGQRAVCDRRKKV
ncbi:IclR family transcriptional regulator [Streptomyces sp. NPDC052052]|uniref:IclR family transcriptional regulator n=1 Tax=Streptomyces sp. NPDC052052 TaxID=3154756 RepID=UPI00342362DC